MTNLISIKNNFDTGNVEIIGQANIRNNSAETTLYNEDKNIVGLTFRADQNDFLYQLRENDKIIHFYHRLPTDGSLKYIRERRECLVDDFTLSSWSQEEKTLTYVFEILSHPEKFDPSHNGIILTKDDKYVTLIREPRFITFTNVKKIVKNDKDEEITYELYNEPDMPIRKFEDKLNVQGQKVKYEISGLYISRYVEDKEIEKIELLTDIVSKEFMPDFEHAFLMDGEKFFCVKYNPKVQSFKTVIAEQKIETLGGRFPLFVRNGNLNYKEIPISGLIARPLEEEELGLRLQTPAAAPEVNKSVADNFREERKYKIDLETWLRNGKPKIFKSAAEGNYIIRLMNVSLQPVDTLGRLLHSFSATGYEVAEYNFDNAIKMGLYNAEKIVQEPEQNETEPEEGEVNE